MTCAVQHSDPRDHANERTAQGIALIGAGAADERDAAARLAPSRKGGCVLYTPEQMRRRDESPWTLVQGVLAPIQFFIFLASLALVLRFCVTGEGYALATASVILKTFALYTIMVTGAIWEREIYGCYLFAAPFYWEDMFSMLVIALHTAYLVALYTHVLAPSALMTLALAAYATYLINAGQFILKLRAARLQRVADMRIGAAT